MNRYVKLVLCISIPLIIGAIAGVATATSIGNWYIELNKPVFNPPNYLFGPVWTLLYIVMGISLYIILQTPINQRKKMAVGIFIIQLFLNFCCSFIFFNFHYLGIAFIEISLLWLSILLMIYEFKKINKTAAYLQIPYLLWVSFATVLNGTIWYLN